MVKQEVRTTTSAIPTLSVNAVRRCLDAVRKHWQSGPPQPLYSRSFPADFDLGEGTSFADFTFAFVLGQHLKRHKKKKAKH